jgi:hypothetical protein
MGVCPPRISGRIDGICESPSFKAGHCAVAQDVVRSGEG